MDSQSGPTAAPPALYKIVHGTGRREHNIPLKRDGPPWLNDLLLSKHCNMKSLNLLTCIIAGSTLLAMKPSFAPVGLMKLTGTKQGDIKGKPSSTGSDGMDISSFKMGSQAPLDPKSPAGQKQHHLVIITKEVDAASPKFQIAVNSGEVFRTVEIQLGKTNTNGKKSLTNVKLANATIAQIRKTEANMEEIAFSFQTIMVQYTDGSTSATDDWTANNQ